MKIYKKGADILTKVAKPVDTTKLGELIMFMGELFNEMYKANGVGLAAQQIGRSIKMVVVDCSGAKITPVKGVMLNPKITLKEGTQTSLEGCLSLSNEWYKIERYDKITVEYVNILGANKIIELEGPTSAVVQHEINHLSGILIDQIGTKVDINDEK